MLQGIFKISQQNKYRLFYGCVLVEYFIYWTYRSASRSWSSSYTFHRWNHDKQYKINLPRQTSKIWLSQLPCRIAILITEWRVFRHLILFLFSNENAIVWLYKCVSFCRFVLSFIQTRLYNFIPSDFFFFAWLPYFKEL